MLNKILLEGETTQRRKNMRSGKQGKNEKGEEIEGKRDVMSDVARCRRKEMLTDRIEFDLRATRT